MLSPSVEMLLAEQGRAVRELERRIDAANGRAS